MKLIILLCTLCFTFTNAQTDSMICDIKVDTTLTIKINPRISKFIVHFIGCAVRFEKNDPYNGRIYYTVEIQSSESGKIIQRISSVNAIPVDPLSYDYGYNFDDDIEAEIAVDINFDGYKDIRFKSGQGGAVNQTYDFYIYNSEKRLFEFNEDISGLTNPIPFADEKIVRAYIRRGFSGTDGMVSEYEWKTNKLILLKTIHYEKINDDSDNYTQSADYYKNGKVIKSESTIIDRKNIPKYYLEFW